MYELKGKYNKAKVFSKTLDPTVREQVQRLLDQPFTAGSKIRIMPDAHAGAGCTIGTTMTIHDKVVPNLVGVDIGCGMETVQLAEAFDDFRKMDFYVKANIPSGFNIRRRPHAYLEKIDLSKLRCLDAIDRERARLSIGTLGGGNHFIEVNRDDEDHWYLVVHSGSRHLGKQVAQHYQSLAAKKQAGRSLDDSLAYCEHTLLEDYLHDMAIVQRYALLNRQAIVTDIIKGLNLEITDQFSTIHNYIDLKENILRKGAISAHKGERVLIPINMRDGSLIAIGKGNADWNYSAPHGAGRLMSRRKARKTITMEAYKRSMEGIYSSTVNKSTLDEAAFAYKPIDEMMESIKDTVEIRQRLYPLYNFKAAE